MNTAAFMNLHTPAYINDESSILDDLLFESDAMDMNSANMKAGPFSQMLGVSGPLDLHHSMNHMMTGTTPTAASADFIDVDAPFSLMNSAPLSGSLTPNLRFMEQTNMSFANIGSPSRSQTSISDHTSSDDGHDSSDSFADKSKKGGKKANKQTAVKAKAMKKYRSRKKAYVTELRSKVQTLQEQLRTLKLSKEAYEVTRSLPASKYELLAHEQRVLARRAQQDNLNLRSALQDQIKFNESLRRLLHRNETKSPVKGVLGESWRGFVLTSDMSQRRKDMEAMIDSEYRRLDTVLLDAGIYESNEECTKDKVLSHPASRIEIIRDTHFEDIDPSVLMNAFWEIITGVNGIRIQCWSEAKLLDRVNENMVYLKLVYKKTYTCYALVKRYKRGNDNVLIWRTVLNDPLYPDSFDNEDVFVANETCWMVIQSAVNSDGKEVTSRKSVKHVGTPYSRGSRYPQKVLNKAALQCLANSATKLEDIVRWVTSKTNRCSISEVPSCKSSAHDSQTPFGTLSA